MRYRTHLNLLFDIIESFSSDRGDQDVSLAYPRARILILL